MNSLLTISTLLLALTLEEDLQALGTNGRGVTLSTCADMELRDVRVIEPNPIDGATRGAGIHIDAFCKRITGSGFVPDSR